MSSTFDDRVNDGSGLAMSEPDPSTSPAALVVLLEQGVDAYREFLAAGTSPAEESVEESGQGKASGRDGNGTSTQ